MHIPRKRLFWAVGLGHFTNDTFIAMGPVLLAYLSVSVLPMTNTQIGFAVSTGQLIGAVSQPFFGLLADRSGGRRQAVAGVFIVVIGLMVAMLAAQSGQYWLMFIPFVLAYSGSGAFHPVGALHAAETDQDSVAGNMSIFFLMGQVGLGIGPAVVGILLDAAASGGSPSLAPIYALSLAAIPALLLMLTSIPSRLEHSDAHAHEKLKNESRPPLGEMIRGLPLRAFLILGVMVTLRSLAQPGSVTFIPVLFQDKGWDPAEYGLITSFFWLAAGIAGVVFGQLADRYDRRMVVMLSMIAGSAALFFLPPADGPLAFALAIAAGGLTGASHSIIVVLAQELIPAARGFASGAILGFIFGTGALGSFIIGGVSDAIGLPTTFELVAVAGVVSGLLALLLPARKVKRQELDPEPATS